MYFPGNFQLSRIQNVNKQTFLRFYQAMMPEFELLTLILFLTIFFLSEFSEVLHWLLDQCEAVGTVHAAWARQLQVQAVASGRIHPLRVLHHVPHRPQHHPPHDEGRPGLLYTALPACLYNCRQRAEKKFCGKICDWKILWNCNSRSPIVQSIVWKSVKYRFCICYIN